MSKLLKDLMGKKCVVRKYDSPFRSGRKTVKGEIIDIDEEWLSISFKNRKGQESRQVIKIEAIESLELLLS